VGHEEVPQPEELGDKYYTGCARTTAAVRGAIQSIQESLIRLSQRYDINPKTVHKWRKRSFVVDAAMGPKPRSTTLNEEQEAIVIAFRKHTLLPLDDCLHALQATIPQLTRSALQRCFQRHGISRLPEIDGTPAAKKKKFKSYPIGYFHIDLTEVRAEEGKRYLFVAIDRTSKFSFAQLARAGQHDDRFCFSRCLQLRPASQDSRRSHFLSVHLRVLAKRTRFAL
jgi:transposase-like protein